MSEYEEKTIRLMVQEGGRLLSEVERLQDENRRLREERDHWHVEQVHAYGNWEDTHKRAIELEAENAKLRELAQDAMKSACIGCPHKRVWRSCEGCNLYERATKLGVEV